MKETLQDIKDRRSCRKFDGRQIDDEQLNAILEAGTWAATGRGMQSPIMIVVQDKPTLDRLSKMNAAILGVTSDPFYGAPTNIVLALLSAHGLRYPRCTALVLQGAFHMLVPACKIQTRFIRLIMKGCRTRDRTSFRACENRIIASSAPPEKLEPLRGRLRDYTISHFKRNSNPTATDKNKLQKD